MYTCALSSFSRNRIKVFAILERYVRSLQWQYLHVTAFFTVFLYLNEFKYIKFNVIWYFHTTRKIWYCENKMQSPFPNHCSDISVTQQWYNTKFAFFNYWYKKKKKRLLSRRNIEILTLLFLLFVLLVS